MPLSMARQGDEISIQRIIGNSEVRHHLTDLGFVPGEKITVVSKLSGNLIVVVKETRVAIDERMANRIIVA